MQMCESILELTLLTCGIRIPIVHSSMNGHSDVAYNILSYDIFKFLVVCARGSVPTFTYCSRESENSTTEPRDMT